MKKILSTILAVVILSASAVAQTTILDFESAATSTPFQYFGSPLDGSVNEVIANPDASGINTSANVSRFVKPAVSEVWAGAFSNPDPTTLCDFTTNGKVRIKVWMDHIGQVALKFENSTNGGQNWIGFQTNTLINQWEELEYDITQNSAEAPIVPAAGFIYTRVVLFFGFGTSGSGTDLVSYFDDIVTIPEIIDPVATTPVLDFETPGTTNNFQYFGSALDGSLNQIIANPNPSGINTSTTVANFVKPAVAEVWAGAFSLIDPTIIVNLIEFNKISIKVHMDHIGSVSLKLENSTDGGDNWITSLPNTVVNGWEELIFDATVPSAEAPGTAAIGHIYTRAILFFDFGTGGTGVDVTSYFDDIMAVGDPIVEVTTPILDFETATTTTPFYYFGSPLDGTLTNIVANPNPTGENTSSTVCEMIKPGVAEVWAGAFSVDNPTIVLDLTGVNDLISIKVHMNHLGVVGVKLENSTDGGDNWLGLVSNTTVNQWEELLFDTHIGSIEAPNNPAYGHTYRRAVVFFDFGTAGTGTDVVNYFDDVQATFPVGTNNIGTSNSLFTLLGNPTVSGYSTLVFGNNNAKNANISISNAIGQTLQTWQLANSTSSFQLPTSDLPSGLYFVTANLDGRIETQKLIK